MYTPKESGCGQRGGEGGSSSLLEIAYATFFFLLSLSLSVLSCRNILSFSPFFLSMQLGISSLVLSSLSRSSVVRANALER